MSEREYSPAHSTPQPCDLHVRIQPHVSMCACVCVHVCVRERERERVPASTLDTTAVCPSYVRMHSHVSVRQARTQQSREPLNKTPPTAARQYTGSWWPRSSAMNRFVDTSHFRMELSHEPVLRRGVRYGMTHTHSRRVRVLRFVGQLYLYVCAFARTCLATLCKVRHDTHA